MNVQKDGILLRELGNKLANFRKKLAIAIGQKKLTQPAFGEMYGGQSPRMMTSYERGEVDPPASLFYLIWKSGNSVDGIFSEEPITDRGRTGAKRLYDDLSIVKLETLDDESINRIIMEGRNAKESKTTRSTTNTPKHPGKRKERDSKTRPIKKA